MTGKEDKENSTELDQQKLYRFLLTIAVPAVMVLCVVLLIGIYRMRSNKTPVASVVPENSANESEGPLESCFHSAPIPFGMKARNECLVRCYLPGADKVRCERGCDRLTVTEFARIPRTKELEPGTVARSIAFQCQEIAGKRNKVQDRGAWKVAMLEAAAAFDNMPLQVNSYDEDALTAQFDQLEQLNNPLTSPSDSDDLTAQFAIDLRSARCVRQSFVATQIAVARIGRSSDLISENFYRGLEQALREIISENEKVLNSKKAQVLAEQQS